MTEIEKAINRAYNFGYETGRIELLNEQKTVGSLTAISAYIFDEVFSAWYKAFLDDCETITLPRDSVDDILTMCIAYKSDELSKDDWQEWKKAPKRDPICMIYRDDGTQTPIWVLKPEDVNEVAFLTGNVKLFTRKPLKGQVEWK